MFVFVVLTQAFATLEHVRTLVTPVAEVVPVVEPHLGVQLGLIWCHPRALGLSAMETWRHSVNISYVLVPMLSLDKHFITGGAWYYLMPSYVFL